MRRPPLLVFLLLTAACADDPAPGAPGPCDTPGGPLVGCPGPDVTPEAFSIEDACARLVECGLYAVNDVDAEGNHRNDYATCIGDLRGGDFPIERLEFVLRCIDVSSCESLAAEHCGAFGGEAP